MQGCKVAFIAAHQSCVEASNKIWQNNNKLRLRCVLKFPPSIPLTGNCCMGVYVWHYLKRQSGSETKSNQNQFCFQPTKTIIISQKFKYLLFRLNIWNTYIILALTFQKASCLILDISLEIPRTCNLDLHLFLNMKKTYILTFVCSNVKERL